MVLALGSTTCVLNLASSAMLNGVCCMYQMQEEEKLQKSYREAIRRSIRSEYERNRILDMEQRLREKEMAVYTSQLTDSRRRNLMAKKTSMSGSSQKGFPTSYREQPLPDQNSACFDQDIGRRFEFAERTDESFAKKSRVSRRSNSFRRATSRLSQSSAYSDSPEMKMSSLLDSEDEEDEFEEITIE
jgi:hypothetical protein